MRMPRRHRVALIASFLGALLAAASSSAAEVSWSQLPQRMAGRLIALEELGVADCPQDIALRQPSRRVLQYIEGALYSWEEHDLTPAQGASYCLVMREPLHRTLTAREAQVLLTASSLWIEQAIALDEADGTDALPADDLDLEALSSFQGDPTPDLVADPAPDLGLVGWLRSQGAPPAAREGEDGGLPEPLRGLRSLTGGSVIGGKDDRTRVGNTAAFPHNAISLLRLEAGARASGFLVGPHMVLTNGHVVWDAPRKEFVRSLTIIPGHAGAGIAPPFGTRPAARLATNPGWVTTRKIQFDYAAAFFNAPFAGIGTFMPLAFDVAPAAGSTVHIAGYPGSVNKVDTESQWRHADKVVSVQDRLLRYRVDTSPGNSGSPVWQVLGGGQVRAIAVHSTGDPTNNGNSGARLVGQNFDLIREWMRWTPQTRSGLALTINQIDPERCPLVTAVASVVTTGGLPVPDLTRVNFNLHENGFPQDIDVQQAEVSDSAIAVALVLDASGSLSSFDVDNIRDASRRFVDLLGQRDRVAVYHFANGVVLVQDYTADKARIKAAINGLDNRGGAVGDGNRTALFDAIIEAANHSTQATGRRALVAMTDGLNNTGTFNPQIPIDAARNAGVPVFTIGFGSVDRGVLDDIAAQTGGRFFLGGSSADLQAILAAIGRTFDQQYLLTWVSSFVSGGTQRVDVAVTDGLDSDTESTTYSQVGTTGCPPPSATCAVQILRPNGGETLTKGKRHTIEWSTTGPSCGGTVGLAISDGSEIWHLVEAADDGSQPLSLDFLPAGPLYRAVIADRATGNFDRSDAAFTLVAPAGGFTCAKGAEAVCLLKGRYQVKVLWRRPQGGTGAFAKAVPVGDAGAYFWFFDKNTPELAMKLVDGRSANAHVWFFSGALTGLEYSLFVTDSTTGETRVYTNREGEFRSFADDTAFGPPPELAAAGPESVAGGAAAAVAAVNAVGDGATTCKMGAEVLCLAGKRIKVEVTWQDAKGKTSKAKSVELTPRSGYFSFGSKTLDLIVKVVDGRTVNGSFWFFFGGLSSPGFTIRLTDVATGRVKTYTNPRGRFTSAGDIQALPGL